MATPKEPLGGSDGTARCQCGRLRYPQYKLCPTCYYNGKKDTPQAGQNRSQPTKPKQMSVAEMLQQQAPRRMALPDRHERVRFLQDIYGQKFKGQEIRYMKNPQLYAISQQSGYRRR
jgi:hypothetical protein